MNVRLLLACGPAGSLIFTTTFLTAPALHPGYSALRQPISALALGPYGWLQDLSFAVFAILTACYAAGLRAVLRPGTGATWAPILQWAAAGGLLIDAFFTQDPARGYPPGLVPPANPTTHAVLHVLGATLAFTALPLRNFALAYRFRQEPAWRGWATYSLLTALVFWGLMAAFFTANPHPAAPAGLWEKAASITMSLYGLLLALRLLARKGL